jgi:hypothetical protein
MHQGFYGVMDGRSEWSEPCREWLGRAIDDSKSAARATHTRCFTRGKRKMCSRKDPQMSQTFDSLNGSGLMGSGCKGRDKRYQECMQRA